MLNSLILLKICQVLFTILLNFTLISFCGKKQKSNSAKQNAQNKSKMGSIVATPTEPPSAMAKEKSVVKAVEVEAKSKMENSKPEVENKNRKSEVKDVALQKTQETLEDPMEKDKMTLNQAFDSRLEPQEKSVQF